MQLVDLTKHGGRADLVVGTKTGSYSGQFMVLKSNAGSPVFSYDFGQTLATGAVTSLTCADYDLDNRLDVVLGVQTGFGTGQLQFWKGTSSGGLGAPMTFALDTTVTVPGIPLALASGDLGGLANPDIVMGYRNDETSYLGGVLIYYMDNGSAAAGPVDPSGGSVTNMVPTLITNDFNYGVKPSTPSPPYLLDVAAGVKSSATTGSLVLFLR